MRCPLSQLSQTGEFFTPLKGSKIFPWGKICAGLKGEF